MYWLGHHEEDNNEPEEDVATTDIDIDPKVGAKKRAKLEAKAEKKAQREVIILFPTYNTLCFV